MVPQRLRAPWRSWSGLGLVLLCCVPPAFGAGAETEHCARTLPEEQQLMCLAALRERAEHTLSERLLQTRQNLQILNPPAALALDDSERAWQAMRDTDCALARSLGGTDLKPGAAEVAQARCLAEHALARSAYVDVSVRRVVASALAAARTRSLRAESATAAGAGGLPPRSGECRFESSISTAPPHKVVALTFDDGPEEGETEYILDVLARHRIRAAFFLIGEKAQQHPDLVARLAGAGHLVIGNHSWSHPNFHDISPELQKIEVDRADTVLHGQLSPRLFRYPYGNASCETNDYLHAQGYRIVGWHIDSCDWAFDQTGAVNEADARICEVRPENHHDFVAHVVASLVERRGGIVLLHEIHPHTLHRLETIVEQLESLGFAFASIDDPAFEASLR